MHGASSDAGSNPVRDCMHRCVICVLRAVDEFAMHFCKNRDGSWTCLLPGTFNGPNGRVQVAAGSRFYPGTVFMGFDLAAWLADQLQNEQPLCEEIERSETDRRQQGERRREI